MISVLRALLIVIGCMLGGAVVGFFGPFLVSQFLPSNPAYSFLIFFTIPFGLFMGLIVGFYFVFR